MSHPGQFSMRVCVCACESVSASPWVRAFGFKSDRVRVRAVWARESVCQFNICMLHYLDRIHSILDVICLHSNA